MSEQTIDRIEEEYNKLNEKDHKLSTSDGDSSANYMKNRYHNVIPTNLHRVILGNGGLGDYINASWMFKDSEQPYICSQGPTPETFQDFWKMVWQYDVRVIVMLTCESENGKVKCGRYWINASEEDYYRLSVVSEVRMNDDLIRREIDVINDDDEIRTVYQYQFIGWQDHELPVDNTSFLKMRNLVNSDNNERKPLVVHCSAGLGRSGCYIAIDRKLREQKSCISEIISEMRESRSGMVQNKKQYRFIHNIIESLSLGNVKAT
jgi:protein tyrosine phosphatase